METMWKTMLGVAGIVFATQAAAQITFYEGEGFRGRTPRPVDRWVNYKDVIRRASGQGSPGHLGLRLLREHAERLG